LKFSSSPKGEKLIIAFKEKANDKVFTGKSKQFRFYGRIADKTYKSAISKISGQTARKV